MKPSRLEDFHVLQEFRYVFPAEVPRLPPNRDIDLTIELVPSKALVSKTPYRVSMPKLLELMMQLQELWEKKYVRPNVSPLGAPVWLMKKKMIHPGCVLV